MTGTIGSPIAIRNAGDGTNRLFILGRNGQIWIKPAASGTVRSTPWPASGGSTSTCATPRAGSGTKVYVTAL